MKGNRVMILVNCSNGKMKKIGKRVNRKSCAAASGKVGEVGLGGRMLLACSEKY